MSGSPTLPLIRVTAILAAAGFCAFVLWIVTLVLFEKRLHFPFPTGFVIVPQAILYLIFIGLVDVGLLVGWKVVRAVSPSFVAQDALRPWYRSFRALSVAPFAAAPFVIPFVTLVAGLLEGPYRPVEMGEIPGRYGATIWKTSIDLTLHSDRSFVLKVTTAERTIEGRGTRWTFEPADYEFDQEPKVSLEGLIGDLGRMVHDDFPRVSAYYEAIHRRGRVRLCWDDPDAPDCLHPLPRDE